MFNIFNKKHTVSVSHVRFKTLTKTFVIPNNKTLLTFLEKAYRLNNFKIKLNLNMNKLDVFEAADIYNINPYLENIDVKNIVVVDSEDFFEQYDINNYEKPLEYTQIEHEYEANYVVRLSVHDKDEMEEFHFPTYLDFKRHVKMLVEANVPFYYDINPDAISVNDYLDILNLNDKFSPREKFHYTKDINQYILDGRILLELEPVVEKTLEIT